MSGLIELINKLKHFIVFGTLAVGSMVLMVWMGFSNSADLKLTRELKKSVIETGAAAVDPALDGRLIHISAPVQSAVGAQDDAFGVRVSGFALRREVAMFQWFEEKSGRGLSKRYEYYIDWCHCRNDSSKFKESAGHENPPLTFQEKVFMSADAKLGAYAIRGDQYAQLAFTRFDLLDTPSPMSLESIAENVAVPEIGAALRAQGWYKFDEETYYKGNAKGDEPAIGDLSVTFTELKAGKTLSLVGVQNDGGIATYTRADGKPLPIAALGLVDAKRMIDSKLSGKAAITSLIVWVGLVLLVISMAAMGRSLAPVLGALPIVGLVAQRSAVLASALIGLGIGGVIMGLTKIVQYF